MKKVTILLVGLACAAMLTIAWKSVSILTTAEAETATNFQNLSNKKKQTGLTHYVTKMKRICICFLFTASTPICFARANAKRRIGVEWGGGRDNPIIGYLILLSTRYDTEHGAQFIPFCPTEKTDVKVASLR